MINELEKIDTHKHEIIIKWQLFEKAGKNIPLRRDLFQMAVIIAYQKYGYKTTASVFDKKSLNRLIDISEILKIELPFIKIANRRDLDWLIGEVPRKIPVYVSVKEAFPGLYGDLDGEGLSGDDKTKIKLLCCVSKYPATLEEYEKEFTEESGCYGHRGLGAYCLERNVSDHTIGLDLFKKYQPRIWEKHYKLSDSTGLDAGPFAITPEELKEVL
jgi:hypothetical protein